MPSKADFKTTTGTLRSVQPVWKDPQTALFMIMMIMMVMNIMSARKEDPFSSTMKFKPIKGFGDKSTHDAKPETRIKKRMTPTLFIFNF